MKAMILAAGRGERLRPLTDNTPKPLLAVGKHSLIEYNLLKLKAAGVRDVIINVHYLGKKIMDYCGDGSRYDLNLVYSYEETCLGTGGGIARVLPLFNNEPFLLVSADVCCEVDLLHLMRPLENTLGRFVLVNNPAFHPGGDYGLSEQGILDFSFPRFTYAGLGLIHPALFQSKKTGAFNFSAVFTPAVEAGNIAGELFQGAWFNVGTKTDLDLLQRFYTHSDSF